MPEGVVNTLHGDLANLDPLVAKAFVYTMADNPPEYPIYTIADEWPTFPGGGVMEFHRIAEEGEPAPAKFRREAEATTPQEFPKRLTKDIYPVEIRTAFDYTMERDRMGPQKSNPVRKIGELIATSLNMTVEAFYSELLSNATSTDDEFLTFDGKPLCATDHVVGDTTYSNIYGAPTLANVTYSSLNELVSMMRRTPSHSGKPLPLYRLNTLWIPVEEELNALEAIKSIGRPDTTNRADNVLTSRTNSGLSPSSVHVLDWMASDRWFGADGNKHPLRHLIIDAPMIEPDVDQDLKHKTYTWYGWAWIARAIVGWRGLILVNRP